MSDTANAYVFAEQDFVDIRRYCGYETYGAGNVGAVAGRYFQVYGWLEYRMRNLTQTEGATAVKNYLAPLRLAEQEVWAARALISTDEAASWKHNKTEMNDRYAAFDFLRNRLCEFFGVPPGEYLRGNNSTRWSA